MNKSAVWSRAPISFDPRCKVLFSDTHAQPWSIASIGFMEQDVSEKHAIVRSFALIVDPPRDYPKDTAQRTVSLGISSKQGFQLLVQAKKHADFLV